MIILIKIEIFLINLNKYIIIFIFKKNKFNVFFNHYREPVIYYMNKSTNNLP
jgi:hypothetical protein